MPTKPITLGPKWNELTTDLWPGESHGLKGDCPNPYCDYELTPQDIEHAEMTGGSFQCPNCGWKFDASSLLWGDQRQRTRSGMSLTDMGKLGEDVVKMYDNQGGFPELGSIVWEAPDYQDPIDIVIGSYALEIKTLHSESFPRFKIAANPNSGGKRSIVVRKKQQRVSELSNHFGTPLQGGLLGTRLNFYTSRADFFYAPDFKDRLMTAMTHVGSTDFETLNPFKRPEDVSKELLPPQGETAGDDIPF